MDNLLTALRKSPAQSRAAVTFDAILDAAAHILGEGGLPALTTNRIAARAGVSIGSLYQYFPNKQAIARALIERHIKRIEQARPAVLDDLGAQTTQVMRAAIDWHFDAHRMNAGLGDALQELARAVLPVEEQRRIAALRRERLGRTVSRLVGDVQRARRDQAVFLVDVCLRAIASEAMHRRPEWLTSADFRAEAADLLAGYLASALGRSRAG